MTPQNEDPAHEPSISQSHSVPFAYVGCPLLARPAANKSCLCSDQQIDPSSCWWYNRYGPPPVAVPGGCEDDQHARLAMYSMERVNQRGVQSQHLSRTGLSFPRPDWLAVARGRLLASGAGLWSIGRLPIRPQNMAQSTVSCLARRLGRVSFKVTPL